MQDPKIDYWMFLRYVVLFILANLGWFGVVSATAIDMGIVFHFFSFHSPDLVP